MTDLQKMLDNSDPLRSAMRRVEEQETLLRDPSMSTAAAFLNQHDALTRTVFGETMSAVAMNSSESLLDQARQAVLGHAYMPKSASETLAEMTQKDLARSAGPLAWLQTAESAASIADPIDFKELERVEKERQLNEMAQSSMEHNRRLMRQAAEAQKREKDKVEYARRSAEASEEALAAANQRATAAEAGQARAEKRETRMLWITVVAVVIGAIGAGASIWALLR